MYAGLKQAKLHGDGRRYYGAQGTESDDECVRRLYVEATGHEPPKPRTAEMALQYEYGMRKLRAKTMRAAVLGAAMDTRELVAA